MRNLLKSSVGFSAGWTTAMVVALICSVALFPMHLNEPTLFDLSHLALSGALDAAALPLLVTSLVALRYPASPLVTSLITALVFVAIRSPWMYRVWSTYGQLPDSMPLQELLILLPTSLVSGYLFGFVYHRVGPNNSFKPTPHRGAGHVPTLR